MRTAIMLLSLIIPLSSAAAQQAAPEPAGSAAARVTRLSPDATLRWDALYPSGMTPSTVTGADLRIAPLPTLRIESDSDRTWSMTGAVVGAIAGAAIGAAVGCLANRDDYGVFCGGQSDTKVVIGALVGAGAGAWIGAVLPGRIR
ncbi:MAG TPA: hypothetical protein VK912_01395 [Longimicrobiales bacterium]|nr:hypothetical protein [Longimicrobiales bacterium]